MQVISSTFHPNNLAHWRRVGQISLAEGLLAKYGSGGEYKELFLAALKHYGILCLGIFRCVDMPITNWILLVAWSSHSLEFTKSLAARRDMWSPIHLLTSISSLLTRWVTSRWDKHTNLVVFLINLFCRCLPSCSLTLGCFTRGSRKKVKIQLTIDASIFLILCMSSLRHLYFIWHKEVKKHSFLRSFPPGRTVRDERWGDEEAWNQWQQGNLTFLHTSHYFTCHEKIFFVFHQGLIRD